MSWTSQRFFNKAKGDSTISAILIYALLMGGLALAAMRWPAAALGVVLCMYGIEQWAQSQSYFFVAHQTLNNYVTGTIVLIGLASKMMRGEHVLRNYPAVGWVVFSLFLLSLMSITWSVYTDGTIDQWRKHWPYVVMIVALCPLLVVEPRDLREGLLFAMILGAVVLTALFFSSEATARFIRLQGGVGVGSMADKGNPLAIATLAGHVVLLAILLNFSGVGRILQVGRWAIVVIGLIMSVKSGSRGQLFALLTALLIFLPISRRIKNIKGFAGVATAVILVAIAALWAHDQFAEYNRWQWDTMVESYAGGRLDTSATLLGHWITSSPLHWLVGLGSSASYDETILGIYPHLVMAEVLAEEGLIGFVLLWAIVILAYKSIAKAYPYAMPYPDARGVTAAIGALFLFEVILSFKQGSMLGNPFAFAFAIIAGRFGLAVIQRCSAVEPQELGPSPDY